MLCDNNGNIQAIQDQLDPTKNRSFTYDVLDRLGTAAGHWGSLGWTYDGVGNRQTENANTYTYAPNTNKLASANGIAFGYDNNGNTTTEAARVYTYNQNQRLIQVTDGAMTANYAFNGNGQRVKKNVNETVTVFHYSLNGQIIAESNSAGTITAEYVYLNGQPLAKMEGTNTYYYHNDHLGTPQKMTDASGVVRWAADYKPFGEVNITTNDITNNLRFPGQYFDAETGLNYNINRTYNMITGRYIEADPLGIQSGINHLYVYGASNPIQNIDPEGLETQVCCRLLNSVVGSVGGKKHCYIKFDDGVTYGLYPEEKNGKKIGVPKVSDSRDTGGDCYPCKKKTGKCEDQRKCFQDAHAKYPTGNYSYTGPNSNTYAGSLAKSCCDGGIPAGISDAPGLNDAPPSQ